MGTSCAVVDDRTIGGTTQELSATRHWPATPIDSAIQRADRSRRSRSSTRTRPRPSSTVPASRHSTSSWLTVWRVQPAEAGEIVLGERDLVAVVQVAQLDEPPREASRSRQVESVDEESGLASELVGDHPHHGLLEGPVPIAEVADVGTAELERLASLEGDDRGRPPLLRDHGQLAEVMTVAEDAERRDIPGRGGDPYGDPSTIDEVHAVTQVSLVEHGVTAREAPSAAECQQQSGLLVVDLGQQRPLHLGENTRRMAHRRCLRQDLAMTVGSQPPGR